MPGFFIGRQRKDKGWVLMVTSSFTQGVAAEGTSVVTAFQLVQVEPKASVDANGFNYPQFLLHSDSTTTVDATTTTTTTVHWLSTSKQLMLASLSAEDEQVQAWEFNSIGLHTRPRPHDVSRLDMEAG